MLQESMGELERAQGVSDRDMEMAVRVQSNFSHLVRRSTRRGRPGWSSSQPPGLPARYPTVKFSMQKDDLLVLYSDALIETCKKQGTPFGLDALRKSLRHAGAMPTQDVAERLAGDLRLFADHSDPLKDDLTIITLRRLL